MGESMSHADDGLLHEYLDGALAAAERERVAAHLAGCGECRTRLAEARALAARAGELLARAAPPDREAPEYALLRRQAARPKRWRLPVTWAASVAAAFAIGWYLQGQREASHALDGVAGPTTIADATAPAPALPPAPVAQSAPTRAATPQRAAAPAAPRAATNATPAAPMAVAALDRKAASSGAMAPAEPAPARRDRAEEAPFDTAAARSLLGRAPAMLPDRPVLTMARVSGEGENGDVVVIEQEVEAGTIIRLYERRAPANAEPPAVAAAKAVRTSERLARYVGALRVEIAGPLPADSLSNLLDLVR